MNKTRIKQNLPDLVLLFAMICIGILFVVPFLWMILVSFERYANITPPFPPRFRIENPSFFNFKLAFADGVIFTAYFNSIVVAAGSVAVNLVAVLFGGYALSKGRFPGRRFIFFVAMGTMMIPFETRMIPMYLMFVSAKLTNNYIPVIFPHLVDGFSLILAKQFFDKLPDSLREASRVDGASELRTFLTVFVPLTGPIVATIVILKSLESWNSFLWPLIVLNKPTLRTIPLYISSFSTESSRLVGSTMAVACLGIFPMIVMFLLLQKYIIQCVALSGLKGE